MKRTLGLCLLLLAFFLPCGASAAAYNAHGVALHGEPKYSGTFSNLDYVNPFAPKGGTLRLGAIGTFDNVNPYILKGVTAANASMVFETLMEGTLDEPFSQYGLIAENVTIPEDRSWVAYRLRRAARFHDGKPITADDVIFSFETLRDKGHPFYRTYYNDVVKVEKTGSHDVKFTFRRAGNMELPLIMGQMPILPQHFWKDKPFDQTTLSPVLGSGPYRIESIAAGRSITYRRVEDWWGASLPINKGRYNFERIQVEYYRDATVALEAFLAGSIDFRLENIAKNWATAYDTPDVKSGLIEKQEIKNELPAGMQGFVFNTRRPLFQDRRVREAIALAFDFEWSNKTLAYGAYKRTTSFFANSELASSGPVTRGEYDLLFPYRDQLAPEVLNAIYMPPVTDGSGRNRENLQRAAALLEAAGWRVKDGALVNADDQPFVFEILENSSLFERWVQPFIKNLERLGIKATYRVVDTSQYQNRLNDFDFDMTVNVFGQSLTPGNEQRDYWGSAKADEPGSRNLAGIKDPVVDALVEKIIHARNRFELITACRALDRVLLWGHYVIPHWNSDSYRIAYWDIFGQPQTAPKYGLDVAGLWWIDPEKKKNLEKQPARSE